MTDFARYHRQMLLPGVGVEGQRKLAGSRVLIVGVGALGCAAADQLARAGVGFITLLDRDVIEITNLQRQTLFEEADAAAGTPKAEAARARLARVNSGIILRAVVRDLTPANAEETIAEARPHVLVDGTDNFETRYLLNDLSVKHAIPFAYAGAVGTRGMTATFLPGDGACLRCIFDEPPPVGTTPTCDTAGVLGSAVAIAASMQAADVIKVLLGRVDLLSRTLTDFDLWTNQHRRVNIGSAARADCPCCGKRRFEFLAGAASDSVTLCGQNAVQVTPAGSGGVDLKVVAERLRPHGTVGVTRFMCRCTLHKDSGGAPALELTVFPDARAIIRGTTKPEVARSIYARYVGS